MRFHQHLEAQRLHQKANANMVRFYLPFFLHSFSRAFICSFLPSCTYLAQHEQESILVIITIVVVVIVGV
jgi:hypothetical protein